jgi:hypothetical protein
MLRRVVGALDHARATQYELFWKPCTDECGCINLSAGLASATQLVVSGEVPWQPDGQNTGTKRMLHSYESSASGGATLLGYAAEIARSSAQKLPKERLQTTAGCSANH